MKMYWTIGAIPGLQPFERREQRRIWRVGATASFGEWRVLAALFVCGIVSSIGSLAGHLVTGHIWGSVVGAGILGGASSLIVGQYITRFARQHISVYLAQRASSTS